MAPPEDRDRKKDKHKKEKKRKRDDGVGKDEDRDNEEEEQRRLVKKAKAFLKQQEKEAKKKDKKDKNKKDKKKKDKKKDKKKSKSKASDDEKDLPRRRAHVPVPLHPEDDYYRRQNEFRVWLKLVRGMAFESLSREEAQRQFEKFVGRWNGGQLEDMYYDGIPAHVQQQCHQTQHKWGFASKLSEEEQFQLERTASRIVATTQAPVPGSSSSSSNPSAHGHGHRAGGASAAEAQYEKELREERERAERRAAQKGVRDKARVALEEQVGGKPTGREALLAARQAKADRLHGAARAREESRDGLEVSESVLGLGGGDERDEVRVRMQRQQERQAQRAGERDRRIEELKAKEEATMKNLLATLGLKPGQKVTIQPRAPPPSEG